MADMHRSFRCRGEAILLRHKTAAVVGSREPSPEELMFTTELVFALVRRGFVIMSGLAKGIDERAHWATIQAKGRPVAAIAHGLNQHPGPAHLNVAIHGLQDEVAERGLLVSLCPHDEMVEWSGEHKRLLKERSRWMVDMSDIVVVCSMNSWKSGTWATMSHALKRESVLCAYGDIKVGLDKEGVRPLPAEVPAMQRALDQACEDADILRRRRLR